MVATKQARAEQAGNGKGVFAGYSPDEPMPLGAYAVLLATWTAGVAGFLAAFSDRLPKRIRWGFLSAVFGAVAISDALQHVYNAEKRLSRA